MKIITILTALFINISAFAATSGMVTVEGTLVGFDDKKVQLDTGAQKIYVPRSAFKSLDGYVAGKAFLTAKIALNEFVKLNIEAEEAAATMTAPKDQ